MKKILLFDTAVGTTNLGDEIILSSVKDGLAPVLKEASVFRLATHLENYSPVQMLFPNNKVELFGDQMDLKFIAGTNLLIPNLRKLHPQFMLNPTNLRLYKDVVLVGVGKSGNYNHVGRVGRILYPRCFSKKYYHSVRDDATKVILNNLGLKAINTGCPTLWGMSEEKCKRIPTEKAKKAIVSVSGYKSQRDPEADKKMLDCVIANYECVYAWIQTSADEDYLRELLHGDLNGIRCIYSLEKYEETLRTGDIDYIGTRLHGGIFALQNECRTLIISIDQRAEGFYKSNNIPILRRSNIDQIDHAINNSIVTEIKLDRNAIDDFLGQFL